VDDGEDVGGAGELVEGGVLVVLGVRGVDCIVVGWIGEEELVGRDADDGAVFGLERVELEVEAAAADVVVVEAVELRDGGESWAGDAGEGVEESVVDG